VMGEGGEHRRPKAVRLLAAAGSILVVGGIVAGLGAASAANNNGGSSRSSQSQSDQGNGDQGNGESNNQDDNQNGQQNDDNGPNGDDFVDIAQGEPNRDPLAQAQGQGSTGSFVSPCGNNENQHMNPDNFIVAPGVANGAEHMHDYVGNLDTDKDTDDQSLAAGGTTCTNGDQSTYYWPLMRDINGQAGDANQPGGGQEGNNGAILQPEATMEFRGNAVEPVNPMPDFLRIITGDAQAVSNGPTNANAKWTCEGQENLVLDNKYPICPAGSRVMRQIDFPSCWDGENLDSADHREHIQFPDEQTGECEGNTQPVPQLRMTLKYNVPPGESFAIDSFPTENRDPITDHGDFVNVMPDQLMQQAVNCINTGQRC
jgi:hypothetical protein